MKIKLTLLFSALFYYSIVLAQPLNTLKLDSLFDLLEHKNKAMGSICIAKNGKILYTRSTGYSYISADNKITATDQTKYRIGSITKMFTATMIFQLIEENKLSLNTTINKYFPDQPNATKITIGDLLNHRSGIHNFTNDANYLKWLHEPKTEAEMLGIIAKNMLDFEPGEKAEYSNSNYVLLGYIIEHVTKQSYATNLKERIYKKANLTHTVCGQTTNVKNNEAYSYSYINGWQQQPETDMSIPGGAGAIVSTPTDLTKFIECLFAYKLISKSSLLKMKTITDGYGMGMFKFPFHDKIAYGHTGGIDGFSSNVAYFPTDSIAIAYISNGQAYPINDIIIAVLSISYNMDYDLPTFNSFIVNAAELSKFTGTYSSLQLPIKIKITIRDSTLMAQATGQSSFPLEPTEKDKFKFDGAGVKIAFDTGKNELTMMQRGKSFLFTKEK